MYTSNVIQIEHIIFGNTYVYVYMYIAIINAKGHKFEREQEGIHGKILNGK